MEQEVQNQVQPSETSKTNGWKSLIMFCDRESERSGVFLRPDGTIEYEGYQPSEAAKLIYDHLEQQFPDTSEEVRKLEHWNSEYKEEIGVLEGRLKAQDALIGDLNKKIGVYEDEKVEQRKHIDDLQIEKQLLADRIGELEDSKKKDAQYIALLETKLRKIWAEGEHLQFLLDKIKESSILPDGQTQPDLDLNNETV